MAELTQLIFSGLTIGAIYALVALGFTLVYCASDVINFAQGDFVMIGGMATAFLLAAGVALPIACAIAVLAAMVVGLLLHRVAIEPVRSAAPTTLIMITIGASIFIEGVAELVFDKQFHSYPGFSGDNSIALAGATILPQSLWVVLGAAGVFIALYLFLERTLLGKALLATAANRLAAQLVGVNATVILALAFGLSAAIGALAGVLATPITLTRYDAGVMFALKGFAAVMIGGVSSPLGAVVGGFLIGLLEALGAGYLSSTYKDAIAFVAILLALFVLPGGLFGRRTVERV